jgi:hypothetical protein
LCVGGALRLVLRALPLLTREQSTQLRRCVLATVQGRGAVYLVCPPVGQEGQGAMFCVCKLDVERAVPELAELFFAPKCAGLACSPRDDFVCVWAGNELLLYDVNLKTTAPPLRHNREVGGFSSFLFLSLFLASCNLCLRLCNVLSLSLSLLSWLLLSLCRCCSPCMRQLSAVAFHPRDPLLAFGDVVGQIFFWRCGTEGQKVCAVMLLCFVSDLRWGGQ